MLCLKSSKNKMNQKKVENVFQISWSQLHYCHKKLNYNRFLPALLLTSHADSSVKHKIERLLFRKCN